MLTTLLILIALPTFGGALLWLTSRLEERVAVSPPQPVVEAVPAESPEAGTPRAA